MQDVVKRFSTGVWKW